MKLAYLYTKSELTPWKENVSYQTLSYLLANTPEEFEAHIEHFDGFDLEMYERLSNYDLVFNVCYGYYDDDQVEVARWLEQMGISHTASHSRQMELAGDKRFLPLLCQKAGLNTPEFTELKNISELEEDILYLSKPAKGSCHRDIYIESGKWMKNNKHLLSKESIIQRYIKGREFSVAVIANASVTGFLSLPPVEIEPECDNEIYIAGQQFGRTIRNFHPDADSQLIDDLKNAALKLHKLIGLNSMSRTDFRVSEDGVIYVLDVNAMPNLDPQKSLLPEICKRNGITITELIRRIVASSRVEYNQFEEGFSRVASAG